MKLNDARPVAPEDHVTKPWWEATREGKLLVQECRSCGGKQLYPRSICSGCGSPGLSYVSASGRATVYSHTTVRRAPHPSFEPPYGVALVRLEEGPVILTNIVDGEPRCDAAARLVWEDLPDGRKLPVFAME